MDIFGNLRFLNLGDVELQNVVIERLGSDPIGATAGRLYYNTTDDELRFYNGTAWLQVGTSSGSFAEQADLDRLIASLGFVDSTGEFQAGVFNIFANISGLTGGSPTDSLVDALSQFDTAITSASENAIWANITGAGKPEDNATNRSVFLATSDPGSPALAEDLWFNPNTGELNRRNDLDDGWDVVATFNEFIESSSTPSSPTTGTLWFNPTANQLSIYNGSIWVVVSSDSVNLEDIGDVTLSGSPVVGDVLYFASSGNWENSSLVQIDDLNDQILVFADRFALQTGGSATAPNLSFLSDSNTGLYQGSPNANEIRITTGGADRLVISADGLTVQTPNYETLVTSDDIIPNRKYVTDNFVDLTSTQTVGGLKTFSNNLTVTGVDGILIEQSQAELRLRHTTGALDEKNWLIRANSDRLTFQIATDAAPTTATDGMLTLARNGAQGDFVGVVDGSSFRVYDSTESDYIQLAHDGTNASIGTVGTGNLNITGSALYVSFGPRIAANKGTKTLPGISFRGSPSALDSGLFFVTEAAFGSPEKIVDKVGVAVDGNEIATFEWLGSPQVGRVTVTSDTVVPGGQVLTVNSSAVHPAYTFFQDEDTGIFHDQEDEIAFSVGGSEVLRIESAGVLSVAATANYETLVTADDDIPNKRYVDDAVDNLISGNLDMQNNRIVNLAAPINGTDATNKDYVDNIASGLSVRQAVTVYVDSDLSTLYTTGSPPTAWTFASGSPQGVGTTLTAPVNGAFPSIDGVTTFINERVLVANQTNAEENGIYVVTTLGNSTTAAVLTRCGGCDENDEIPSSFVFVQEGTVYADTGWVADVVDVTTFQVDQDPITWLQFTGSGAFTAGAGLTLTGTQFDVGAGTGITVNANDVALDTASSRNTDHTAVNITAGNGLTGGGDISASRTLNVGAGDGIDVNTNDVAVDNTVVRTTGAQTIGGVKTFTNQTLSNLGTVTSPGIAFDGDTNTGVYSPGADNLSISAGASLVASFTSDQVQAVAANTPATPAYSFLGDTDTGMYRPATNTISFATNGLQRFQVQSDGTLAVITANYETLVTDDDDIPNKKYVDDAIALIDVGSPIVAGDGLTQTGSTFDVGAGDGITVSANDVAVDSTVVRTTGNQSIADVKDFTGRIRLADGNGSQPSLSFTSDGDTGLTLAAPNTMRFVTSGVGRLQIEASGRLNAGVANYETLVNADNVIPNKKYVDDLVDDATIVRTTGNQTIGGNKTFTSQVVAGGNLTTPNFAMSGATDTGMYLAGGGALAFAVDATAYLAIDPNGTIRSPQNNYETLVTADDDIPNKKYVDDLVDNGTVVRTTGAQSIAGIKTFTNQTLSNLGTVTSPGIAFDGDTNTGIYSPGADNLSIAAGGSIVASFTSDQIQTVAANTPAAPGYSFLGDTDTGIYRPATNTLSFATGGTQRFQVQSDGTLVVTTANYENLVVGDDDIPNKKYVDDLVDDATIVRTTGNQTIGGAKTFTSAVSLADGNAAAPGLRFSGDINTGIFRPAADLVGITCGGVERTRFTSAQVRTVDGTVALPAYSFLNDADTGIYLRGVNQLGWVCGGNERMFLDASGNLTTDGDITAFSDVREKENLEPIVNALDKVKSATGYTYNRKGETKRSIGVIAQELLEVAPEAVDYDEDRDRYSVAYGNLTALLIEAVKELEEKNASLEARIKELETK